VRWSTHAAVGAAAGSLIGSVSGSDLPTLVVIGVVFGVAPDVDIVLGRLSRGAHRSPVTHSVLGALLFSVAWAVFCSGCRAAGLEMAPGTPLVVSSATVFLSSFLHAASDTVSVSGCRALYPFSNRKFRGPVRYDDWAANAALTVIAVGVLFVTATTDLSSHV